MSYTSLDPYCPGLLHLYKWINLPKHLSILISLCCIMHMNQYFENLMSVSPCCTYAYDSIYSVNPTQYVMQPFVLVPICSLCPCIHAICMYAMPILLNPHVPPSCTLPSIQCMPRFFPPYPPFAALVVLLPFHICFSIFVLSHVCFKRRNFDMWPFSLGNLFGFFGKSSGKWQGNCLTTTTISSLVCRYLVQIVRKNVMSMSFIITCNYTIGNVYAFVFFFLKKCFLIKF